ncbi:MAG TPA: rhomboid family intramembrane serine protease [Acidobacteriaceae bacterium]|nr:rhomboid family intramembrane serine protease [Acidobacteriaceae bacterium]
MAFRSNGPVTVALPPFRGVTRQIILAAVIVFFALLVCGLISRDLQALLGGLFALQPELALHRLVWQLVTYPFVTTGLFGLLFAVLTVWFFGSTLEDELGSRWMGEFFVACTLGGALVASVISLTIGRSVEGLGPGHLADSLWPFSLALLLVFARLHPDQELNFNFILRVKAKYIAILYVLLYLAIMLSTHQRFDALLVLTNALCGWLFLRFAPRRGVRFAAAEGFFGLRNAWYRSRRRRAAKKFTVYMQKQGREVQFDERGRYIDPDAERRDPNDRKWMN